jgi:hypothetical protein
MSAAHVAAATQSGERDGTATSGNGKATSGNGKATASNGDGSVKSFEEMVVLVVDDHEANLLMMKSMLAK